MSELHVIFGAGQIGPRLARELLLSGHRVRVVRRSDKPIGVAGVEVVAGDARDPDFAIRASEGASVHLPLHEPDGLFRARLGGRVPAASARR